MLDQAAHGPGGRPSRAGGRVPPMVELGGPAVTTDRPPFQELVQDHLPWLYRLARRLGGDDAEDIVQDALMKAYQRRESLRDEAAVAGWLRQIVINCARDRIRAEQRRKEEATEEANLERYSLYRTIADEDPFPYSDSLHLDFLSVFDEDDLWAVLDRLPGHYRLPLALVHMEGFSTKQAARLLGSPLGTVLSQLHRGRKRFEKELWEYATERGLLSSRIEQGAKAT